MKKITLVCIAIMGMLFLGCSSDEIFNERKNQKDMKWMRFEPDVFKVNIRNPKDCYDLYLGIKHSNQIKQESLRTLIKITSPSGETRVFLHTFKVRNNADVFLGHNVGNIWEIEDKIREYYYFNEKGEYQISIQNNSQWYEIEGIIDVSLRIVKSNTDFKIEE